MLEKRLDFDSWTERMGVSVDNRVRLKVMLKQAPKKAHNYLDPEMIDGRLTFTLTEVILVGVKDR